MSDLVWLLRHGDTTWTEDERHTGRKDVPLSAGGRAQTLARHPCWDLFTDGAPNGESAQDVAARVEAVIERCRQLSGPLILVGHGKMLRALAARWIAQPVALAAALPMDPAAISLLERAPTGPLLKLWNYTGQV